MIDQVEAEEYYFVSHANFQELNRVHGGYIPPIDNKKYTHYIGVSQFATDKLDEYAKTIGSKIKTQRCYNPLTLEEPNRVVRLVSACRLDDKVKGGERTLRLIEALDRYCEKNSKNYLWTIFTNPSQNIEIKSPNVVLMKPRIDVRPYIADSDWCLQLSNDMETYCYTINEALGYGVPIVATPLTVIKELPITDNELITLDWNCENVEEVARLIFEKQVKPFRYNPPEDNWEDFLVHTKSTYKEELEMKYTVRATSKYQDTNTSDNELSEAKGERYIPKAGEEWQVDLVRKEKLLELGFVTVVETAKKEPKVEKAVKKTTKKTK